MPFSRRARGGHGIPHPHTRLRQGQGPQRRATVARLGRAPQNVAPSRRKCQAMAEPSLEIPEPRARAVADGMPRWLAEVLATHGLEPHDGWPPAHHRLTERDLPCEEDEDDMLHTTQVRVVQELCAGLEMRYEARDDVLIAQELLVYFDGERPFRAAARASFTVWEEAGHRISCWRSCPRPLGSGTSARRSGCRGDEACASISCSTRTAGQSRGCRGARIGV